MTEGRLSQLLRDAMKVIGVPMSYSYLNRSDHYYCKLSFINFRDLVDRANEWLSSNRAVASCGLQVRTCETVTWMSADDHGSTDGSASKTRSVADLGDVTLLSKSVLDRSKTYYTRGLRYEHRIYISQQCSMNRTNKLTMLTEKNESYYLTHEDNFSNPQSYSHRLVR